MMMEMVVITIIEMIMLIKKMIMIMMTMIKIIMLIKKIMMMMMTMIKIMVLIKKIMMMMMTMIKIIMLIKKMMMMIDNDDDDLQPSTVPCSHPTHTASPSPNMHTTPPPVTPDQHRSSGTHPPSTGPDEEPPALKGRRGRGTRCLPARPADCTYSTVRTQMKVTYVQSWVYQHRCR